MTGKYTNITTQTTTVVRSKKGKLLRIIVNEATALGVITIYDGITVAGGTLIGTITMPGTLLKDQEVFLYDVDLTKGLTIVTATATQDITVVSSA